MSLNVHCKYNLLNILIMKKQILNIGKILNKSEQKEISGGLSYLTKVGPGGLCHTSAPGQCASGTCKRGSGDWGLCA